MEANLATRLEGLTKQLSRRYELTSYMVSCLRRQSAFPANITIPANYTVTDAQAIRKIFESVGLEAEVRFVTQGLPYFRFFEKATS